MNISKLRELFDWQDKMCRSEVIKIKGGNCTINGIILDVSGNCRGCPYNPRDQEDIYCRELMEID